MRQRSVVVFPVPVPPATMRFCRACTAAVRNAPRARRSRRGRPAGRRRWMSKSWRRMVTVGRPVTAMRAWSRSPLGSWRFSSGWAWSQRRSLRPTRRAAVAMSSTSSASESATAGPRTLRAVAQLEPGAVVAGDVDVADVRVVEQRLEPAEAVEPVEDERRQARALRRRVSGCSPWSATAPASRRSSSAMSFRDSARSSAGESRGRSWPRQPLRGAS